MCETVQVSEPAQGESLDVANDALNRLDRLPLTEAASTINVIVSLIATPSVEASGDSPDDVEGSGSEQEANEVCC